LASWILQGSNEGRQVGELEEILVAGSGDTRLSLTLSLLGIEATGLLAGEVNAALRVAHLVAQNGFLGPLTDQLAAVGDAQRGTLSLKWDNKFRNHYTSRII